MKKIIPSLVLAAIMAAPAATGQKLSVNGVEYATFQEAFNAIENEGTIDVLQDFEATPAKNDNGSNANAALLVGNKKITVNGNGHNIGFKTFFVFNLLDLNGSLAVNNLKLTYIGEGASNRGVINVGKGRIDLSNVHIQNANTTANGIISLNNSNSNIPSAVLNGVKLENCTTTANAEVLLANDNLTIAGDCAFSLYVNNSNSPFTPAAGENLAGSISLSFAKTEVGATAVRNCTDTDVFTLNDENLALESNGTDLVIAENKPEIAYPVYIGDKGYETLNAAITAVADGGSASIELKEDIILTGNLSRTAGKTISVNGNNHTITRGDIGARFIAVTNSETTSLTFNDVIIDGNNAELTVAAFQASNSASLTLANVTFANFSTTNARGIVDAANGGQWHLNGVKFENCTVANQDVTTNGSAGCSISGDNNLTLRVNGDDTSVDASGVNNSTPVTVTLGGNYAVGRIVFTGCTDLAQFACANSKFKFDAKDGNLVVAERISTAIENINADNKTTARYYNLQGVEVSADNLVRGIYIVVTDNKVSKIQVR